MAQGVMLLLELAAGVLGPAWAGPARATIAAAGVLLMAAGAGLGLRGIVDLRDALTPFPHPRAGSSLVEHGVYARVRHPIYGGIVTGSLGYGLATASPAAALGAAALLAFFRLKSAREEAWLDARYPAYPAYRGRTRRFLPGLY